MMVMVVCCIISSAMDHYDDHYIPPSKTSYHPLQKNAVVVVEWRIAMVWYFLSLSSYLFMCSNIAPHLISYSLFSSWLNYFWHPTPLIYVIITLHCMPIHLEWVDYTLWELRWEKRGWDTDRSGYDGGVWGSTTGHHPFQEERWEDEEREDYYANWKSSPIVLSPLPGLGKWVGKVIENRGRKKESESRKKLCWSVICSSKQDSKICRLSRYGILEWWDDIVVVHCNMKQ